MAIAPQEHPREDGPQSRPVLGGARVAQASLAECLPERVWALSDDEVRGAAEALGHVVTAAQSAMVAVLAEARRRGLSTSDGWSAMDWARSAAPLMPERTLRDLDAVAAVADELRLEGVLDAVAEGVRSGDQDVRPLPVVKAAQVVRFHTDVRSLADPTVLAEATATLIDGGRGADGLSERNLAAAVRYAADHLRSDRLVEDEAGVRRAMRSLVKGAGPLGMWRYTLLLDEEGAAIVDAAVDALAKPEPDAQTGEPDLRRPAARRADALIELVARAVSAPDGVPRQAKTSLVLTIGLDALVGRCRGAGLSPAGDLLTAGTVRRLACDAEVIPMVLGADGEILDQGQAIRLFNRAQIRHLWIRDRGCTFPGCSKPAAWTDAHHLIHWVDDGPTDLDNAALLCRAHHTVVHSHGYGGRLVASPTGPRVEWDLTTGSYQRRLGQWRRERAGPPSARGRPAGGAPSAGGP
ncbi:HNH endonuclease signature motif containing protein [Nostocoides sp. HKS02]|uniref:HNH endonuclease signature motif containing protein n=1 Tax=Nostocoides sp. HKS02 TaxID=1813880 RepID=UPI0012B474C9|nr:HNH endonuclease signature motif containing protein [Tetrasphaera sp. HKS02]QGN57672.1 DUF222 domain-containing protein [Tetrasphaera sp. HKS02]